MLDHGYGFKKMLLNFCGIITPSPPNGPAWFVTYIIFLYLIYFTVSQIRTGNMIKIMVLFLLSYVSSFMIWWVAFLEQDFYIWTLYTIVFPLSVLIGIYQSEANIFLSKFIKHPVLYVFVIAICLFQYVTSYGVLRIGDLIDSKLFLEIVKTSQPITFIISLAMVSFLLDNIFYRCNFLSWMGKHSFEIFLIHLPFMVYYDFFLFRKPLAFFFFVYFAAVIMLSISLRLFSNKLKKFVFYRQAAMIKTIASVRPGGLTDFNVPGSIRR